MAARKLLNSLQLLLVAAFLLSTSACASTSTSLRTFELDNNLAACKEFNVVKQVVYKNLLLVKANVVVKSKTSECGCKSAALRFKAVDKKTNITLSNSIFLDSQKSEYYFPVLTDNTTFKKANIKLSITCENSP